MIGSREYLQTNPHDLLDIDSLERVALHGGTFVCQR
jgi:hypothetical protein